MTPYDAEQAGRDAGYFGLECKPPAIYSEEWLVGYEFGWEDFWVAAGAICVEMAVAQDARRRAS
jgi:hypothetical protein